MALFDRSALNPGVATREVFGWAMYDFANSGYTTVVLTAVFNVYFIGVVARGADWGTLAWTLALVGRGDLWLAVVAIVLSNFFYSISESITAALSSLQARASPACLTCTYFVRKID